MSRMRPICAKCKVEMECVKNEVAVWHPIEGEDAREMMKYAMEGETIDFVAIGDRYECPNCSASIVIGFGKMLTAANRDQKYLRAVIDSMEEQIRILR